jgi:hypothetical protein
VAETIVTRRKIHIAKLMLPNMPDRASVVVRRTASDDAAAIKN